MIIKNFQTQLIRYLAQDPRGFSIVESIPLNTFDLPEHQLVLDLLKIYRSKLKKGGMPSVTTLHQLLSEQTNVPDDVRDLIHNTIIETFEPIDNGLEMYHAKAVEIVQHKLCFDLFSQAAPALSGLDDAPAFDINKTFSQMRRIVNLDVSSNTKKPLSLLWDKPELITYPKIHPTCFQGLNDLTSVGGFYSPQLIILMGGPKGFKTGLGLNLMYGYLAQGLKIYIPDFENGETEMYNRLIQRMVHCTEKEVFDLKNIIKNNITLQQIYESTINFLKKMGGDIRINAFSALQDSTNEVEAKLDYLANEDNFKPDVTMWDYLDLMMSTDRSIKEERFRIRDVYHNVISLNKTYDMLSFSFSQVSKDAVRKEVIDLRDFAEAFNKAANCHAAFALCRTDDELKAGTGRLVPVLQRKGARYDGTNEVYLQIEEEYQTIHELILTDENVSDD